MVGVLAQYWNWAQQMEKLREQVVQSGRRGQESRQIPRRMPQLTKEQVARLVAAREVGAEINQLATEFGVHRATVINHLHRAGVPGRKRQGRTLGPDQVRAAGELYASGVSLIEVGEQFDVDRRHLRKVLPENGFELRPPGRQSGG